MAVTFVMLKPDCIKRQLSYDVMEYFKKNDIQIDTFDVVVATEEKVREHYAEVIAKLGEDFARKTLNDFKDKLVVPIVLKGGDNVIADVRKIVGATQPAEAGKGTIRGDLGMNDSYALSTAEGRIVRNVIHASDSPEAVRREIGIWLPKYKF